jgi:hypothetical protein
MADLNNASGMSAISIEEQASDPAALTGHWKLFPKSGGIYAISPAGAVVGPFATVGGTSAAPGDAKYVVQTADADLPNAQALGALTTGLLKNTTTTGVLSIAAAADLPAHASRHQSGGADAIKLDDLAAPDDNTDLNATTSAHGLLPKLPGGTTTYLRADGTFATPAGTGTGIVETIVAGTGISVDSTDPANPIVTATGGGGSGGWERLANCYGTVGAGGAASVTLPSSGTLPTGYRAYKLISSARSEVAAVTDSLLVQPNGDTTAANYVGERIGGQGTTAAATQNVGSVASIAPMIAIGGTGLANSFAAIELTILSPESTTKLKQSVGTIGYTQATTSGSYIAATASGLWNSTSAITTLVLKAAGGDLAEGTEYALYGLP